MRRRTIILVVLVTASLGALSLGTGVGAADSGDGDGGADTRANYTPFTSFTPLATSSACPGEGSGRQAQPFVIPPGYIQQVVAEESDPLVNSAATQPGESATEDLWDMNTQNESGKFAGRFLYRTHEVGAAPNAGDPPRRPGGSQVTVTDLQTGLTYNLAERNDWERFDGIVWTPWGTILAAEETITASRRDPTVPQAVGGLVYELFVDKDEPWKLDASRERVTPGDGTTDAVQDGIRARPALGAKSHEGLRFDRRGYLYGIAESRGQTVATQSGGIFRFVPDRKGDLSSGELSALRTADRRYGPGEWVPLDRTQVQIDADAHAKSRDVNLYQRPEDVETGQSTGRDVLNGGWTLYVAITEGAENGVLNVDLTKASRPFAYPYVGPNAGNAANPVFTSADNLALDRKGNLAITEDGGAQGGGDDVWIAAPPRSRDDDDNGSQYEPARTVQRFASIKDCEAEPTGVYFAMAGTERWTDSPMNALKRYDEDTVNGETLFVNRQHAEETSPIDQLVAVTPAEDEDADD
jgi:uncharacterized protein